MSQWTLACGNSRPAAADHIMSIRGSRCTALINAYAEESVTRQLSGGTATVATGRLRSLLQGMRVTYVTETFPFSRSLRVTSDD